MEWGSGATEWGPEAMEWGLGAMEWGSRSRTNQPPGPALAGPLGLGAKWSVHCHRHREGVKRR